MKRTVIVTGSSKGIGAAAAIMFAQKGFNVVINYNESYESASLLCSSLVSNGYSVITQKANVANKMEVDLMVKETLYKFGSIDVLINNAGIAYQGLITDTDEIDFDRIIDIDLKGVFNCCKSVTQTMVNQKSGTIINRRFVRGCLFCGKGGRYRSYKGACKGVSSKRNYRQLHSPRSYRNGYEFKSYGRGA